MCAPCLPAKVWTLVFRHLSLSDRLKVRASCKSFRDLVDDDALWRDWTVELRKWRGEGYEEDFWRMLRRWRVTSARLFSSHSLTQIAKELPGLTTLIISHWDFTDLRGFTNLERLHLYSNVSLEELSPALPQRVTHLRLCQLAYTPTLPTEIPPDSPFKKLKSFAFHCMYDDDTHPVNVLHFFLSSLPQLQHLSLVAYAETSYEGDISQLPPLNNCSLSSLELVNCKIMKLPMDFMKMLSTLPFLQSLAIFSEYDYVAGHDEFYGKEPEKLSVWLRDLPALTSLAVACAHVGGRLVRSIPSSVTRLILKPLYVDSWIDEMTALSAQLPSLRHLHLEASHVLRDREMEPYLRSDIPRLFPRLKTLRVRRDQVPEDALVSLASLKELEVLETLDVEPLPAALVSKLRGLANCRVRIYNRPESLWLMPCGCTSDIPTDYWA